MAALGSEGEYALLPISGPEDSFSVMCEHLLEEGERLKARGRAVWAEGEEVWASAEAADSEEERLRLIAERDAIWEDANRCIKRGRSILVARQQMLSDRRAHTAFRVAAGLQVGAGQQGDGK